MQHEKRRRWVVQGCFFTLLAFVLALSELHRKAESGVAYIWDLCIYMHISSADLPLQDTDLCTLRSQSVIPNQNSIAGPKPKGKHKHTKQRKQARDRQADLFQVTANDYMVLWSHVVAIPQQQGQWGPKGVRRPSSRTPTHLCSILIVFPVLLAWHLS